MHIKKITAAVIYAFVLVVFAGCSGSSDPNSLFKEARLLFDQGKFNEAAKGFDQVIKLAPKRADAHFFKGNALSALGRKDEAIKEYDTAIALEPDVYQPYYNKGNALAGLGRYEEAIACYDKTISMNPKHLKSYMNKSALLRTMGRNAEAESVLANAKEAGATNGGAGQ